MINIDNILLEWSYRCKDGIVDLNNPEKKAILEQVLTELGIEDAKEITEVSLSPTQLEKPYPSKSDLSGQYKDRGERFLDKILNNEDFTLNDGSTVKIDQDASSEAIKLLQNKDYKSLGRGSKMLVDTNGKEYSLSQFKKTEEFGSGKGSGGGAAATATQESSQCVANAIAYHIKKGNISQEDINDENINKALQYVDTTSSPEEMKLFLQNPSWINTLINTANSLLFTYPNPNFEFHRESDFTGKIYDAFKEGAKKQGISMQADKWNPADIWLVDPSIKGMNFPNELDELNAIIADLFAGNKLVGVSLKKLSGEPKLTLFNISKDDIKGYKFEELTSSNKSKDIKIKYSDGGIVFRTFNFATNYAGEIQGKAAQGGKIGRGAINDALKLNNLPLLPSTQDIKTSFESEDSKIIEDFYSKYKEIVEPISQENFMELFNSKDMDWKVSKYMSVTLGDIINKNTSKQDEFISDLIRYASSSTKISSAFVKVS
jgi:hypothetical protein